VIEAAPWPVGLVQVVVLASSDASLHTASMTTSAPGRHVLDAIADYVETRQGLAVGEIGGYEAEVKLDEIAQRWFVATQLLQPTFDDPRR